MKVCHFSSVHNRYDTRIFQKECKSLAKAGYDVYYIVADGKTPEIVDGVHIESVEFKAKNRAERILKSRDAILGRVLSVDADIYHFHDPELLPIGLKLKRYKKTVIFDCHDDTVVDILEKHWIPSYLRKIIAFAYKKYEGYVLPQLDSVITVTPSIVERMSQIGIGAKMITNYPIYSDWENINADTFRATKQSICFAGAIYSDWCHEIILDALDQIKNVNYILAGDSSMMPEYYEDLKKKPGWIHVEFLGKVSKEDVKKIYSRSIAGVVLHRYCASVGNNLGTLGNNKMFELMASARPIICTDFTLWKKIVDKWKVGLYVNPSDLNGIINAIRYIVDHPLEAQKMGENGRQAVKTEYNWGTQEAVLLDLYESLSHRNKLLRRH